MTASVSLLRFGNVQLISSGFLCDLIEFSAALSILHCKMCQCLTNENKSQYRKCGRGWHGIRTMQKCDILSVGVFLFVF